ncbi:MAG: hypothetical protein ACXVP5_13000 [Tumebacillaceae bacterium]
MFNIYLTPRFEKDVLFYKRKKRYIKIDDDINSLVEELENGNLLGDELQGLLLPTTHSALKVRVANTSAKTGKLNGFRLIYYVILNECDIFLLTIYSKKDQENIAPEEILRLINQYCT